MFDLTIVLLVQRWFLASSIGAPLAIFLAKWFILAYIPIGGWILAFRKGRERHAVFEAICSAGIALFLRSLLSLLIDRPRPFLASSDVTLLISPPFHTSFPSGHTTVAFAIASALFAANRRIGVVAFCIAFFVAIGRVAVGVHYPTDLLGGAIVGIASFAIVRAIYRHIRHAQ